MVLRRSLARIRIGNQIRNVQITDKQVIRLSLSILIQLLFFLFLCFDTLQQSNLVYDIAYALLSIYIIIYSKYYMNIFGKFKTYFVPINAFIQQQTQRHNQNISLNSQNLERKASVDSFQLIFQDIIAEDKKEQSKGEIVQVIEESKANQLPAKNSQEFNPKQSEKLKDEKFQDPTSDYFETLVEDEITQVQTHEQQQYCHNMYLSGIIFINKYSEGRQITLTEWNQMIQKQNLYIQPQKNIYFSILKGIHFSVRKKVWELLSNTLETKKLTTKKYEELIDQKFASQKDISIIDKDVPRSVNITKFTKELRNILIAYVNFSGRQYTQGMNLIAGSLLQMLSYQNDPELQQFGIIEESFQERVFWVFIGIMDFRNWNHIFEKDLSGLKEMLGKLQKLMVEYVPAIYQKIIDYEWDLTIFSQYYITILIYNTPKEFAKIILDLFLMDGENVVHSLVLRMLKLNEDYILSIVDEGQLMQYFKKKMISDTFSQLQKDKINAKKLEDFQINFISTAKL